MVQDRRKCSEQGSDSPSVQVSCGEKLMKSSHHNYSLTMELTFAHIGRRTGAQMHHMNKESCVCVSCERR